MRPGLRDRRAFVARQIGTSSGPSPRSRRRSLRDAPLVRLDSPISGVTGGGANKQDEQIGMLEYKLICYYDIVRICGMCTVLVKYN